MIRMTTSAQPTPAAFDSFVAQVESVVRGVMSMNPEEAALRGGLTVLVFIGALILIWGLRLLLKALTERVASGEGDHIERRKRVGKWTMRIARFAIIIAAILIALKLWGFDFADLRRSALGAFVSVAGRIALILIIAIGAIELSQYAIRQVFTRIAKRARTPRRSAQVNTLAPLFIGVVTTTCVVIAAMMSLSEIGVEIGPLIAGAGIVGLAVGFGAQTLVKDFLTGIFLILEDIVSVGDSVRIGDFSGVVEEMSLRTIKLRDFDGTLHVFPYSEAQVIHNRTKNFGYAVFELQVSYLSDIDKAIAVARETAETLAKDEKYEPLILAPAEVLGVDAITDNAVMIKGRIKTRPGDQWRVRREFNRRIKYAFDAAGVLFEHRHAPTVPFDEVEDEIAAANRPAADR